MCCGENMYPHKIYHVKTTQKKWLFMNQETGSHQILNLLAP